ncbi:MAG: type II toxin-antitoxin system RelE/ParE family toxin [Gammaproteobacteria bacterium]|nr:MAG: type II toxin-antitoxin system RelE/ParE family toxin [Gammaproteobacteria bacterium]
MIDEKPIYWIGSSYKDLLKFPDGVKKMAGYQLHRVQSGLEPDNYKHMKTIGSGVKEIRLTDSDGNYRIIYIANFGEKIYVLHSFNKKSQKTSQQDIKIAKKRFMVIKRGGNL